MGLIKEPKGVDFVIEPSVLTEKDKKMISEIISAYKLTGKIPSMKKDFSVRDKLSLSEKKSASKLKSKISHKES